MNIQHEGSRLFVTWFTYDDNGRPWWLAMTADPQTGLAGFRGTLYDTTGPAFNSTPFDPRNVRTFARGQGTLTFTDAAQGTFSFTVNGISRTKAITQQVFGQLPTCTYDLGLAPSTATNYQGLWWASPAGSGESGWGLNLAQQGATVFATWFTYDLSGTPLWLAATLTPDDATGKFTGDLYQTSGPPFSNLVFDPSRVAVIKVGSIGLSFSDGNTGTFVYTLYGTTQTKAITRQVIVDPGTICQ